MQCPLCAACTARDGSRGGAARRRTAAAESTSLERQARSLRLAGVDRVALAVILGRYGLDLILVAPQEEIPGARCGECAAGRKGDRIYARLDAPLHAILHAAGHYVCMTPERRAELDRDVASDRLEERAVCYLQVLLAGELAGAGQARLCADMDEWGYGLHPRGVQAWFESEARDARAWLADRGMIDESNRPTWSARC